MLEQIRKLFTAVEKKDSKLAEEAVQGMLQDEGVEKKESAEVSEVDSLVKHLLACKKEMKQEEGEASEAYEARCAKEAVERMKKESAKPEEAADEKPAEKTEAVAEKPADHPDEKQDVELIKKMMAKMEQMEARLEALAGDKKESEGKHKEAKESEASLKIEKKIRERADLIDKVLRESGLPRSVTKEIKPVLESCKSEQDIKDTAKRLADAAQAAVDSFFVRTERYGVTEAESKSTDGTTDHLFK